MQKTDIHLVLLNDAGKEKTIFIVPGAGGRCENYHELAMALAANYTVYGMHMMGTEKNELPLNSIEEIAAKNIRWIRDVQPSGPYRLIGHSFGGHVAFEMARQLEAAGEKVVFVIILDVVAGLFKGILPGASEVDFALQFAADYFRTFNIIDEPYPDWIATLREDLNSMQLKDMAPWIGAFVGQKIPDKKESIEFVARLIDLRIYNACMEYKPKGKIKAEIIVFRTYAGKWWHLDKTLGWRRYARKIKSLVLSGNHTMNDNENSDIVSGYLMSRSNL